MPKTKLTFALLAIIIASLACSSAEPIPTAAPQPPGDSQPPRTTFDCLPANTEQQRAELLSVIDGDTIEVRVDGQVERVRYIGVDTPEREDPWYAEASAANQILLGAGELLLVRDVSETDRFDRLLRYVFTAEGVFVNYELLRGGYAHLVTFPPDVACTETFLTAQQEARNNVAGIWALPQFVEQENPAVVIESVFYNGANNPSEGDEYAEIVNVGDAVVDLGGWTLNAGGNGQDFNFPAYLLQPGERCRVYTNESHPETCGFNFGIGEALWSNGGDCGNLYDPEGNLVNQYCYSGQ